jgi:hypothetical protein
MDTYEQGGLEEATVNGDTPAPQAFVRHNVEDFLKYDLGELSQKRLLASLAVRAAREALDEGDPRAPKALEYYLAEREAINGAISILKFGDEGPPNQTVGMQPLSMAGRSRGRGRAPRGVVQMEDLLQMFQ